MKDLAHQVVIDDRPICATLYNKNRALQGLGTSSVEDPCQ